MNIILSISLPVLEFLAAKIQNDAGNPGIYLAIGLGFLLAAGAVITILIVVTVKLLKHFRNKKTKDD